MSNCIITVLAVLGASGGLVSQIRATSPDLNDGKAGTAVSFKGFGGLSLEGTLLTPNGAGPFPALLLLSGSGPTDRDGNQPGLQVDTLKDIAEKLADRGVATLRFDKRAIKSTYGGSFPKTMSELNDFFSWDAFVEDAKAAFGFLKSQPNIDPAHVGILGHSEGGVIALAMAADVKPFGLVLVSTPGRDLGDLIIDQVEHGFSAQFADADTLKKRGEETERIVNAIRATKAIPDDVPTELKALFPAYLPKYLYSVFTFEPATAAQTFIGPVLIVQGEKDVQVSPIKDGPVLFASFPKGKSEYYIAQGCSHCLKHPTGPQDPGFSGPTDEAALDKIGAWTREKF